MDQSIKILAVEDFKSRITTFKQVCTYLPLPLDVVWKESYKELPQNLSDYSIVMLDHDLYGNSFVDPTVDLDNGTVFVDAVKGGKHTFRPNVFFIVHSHNPGRGVYMNRTLREAGYRSIYVPYYVIKSLLSTGVIEDPIVRGKDNRDFLKDVVTDLTWKMLGVNEKKDKFAWVMKVIDNLYEATLHNGEEEKQ